ncbi:hypothetical protein IU451_28675 [Nocardia cyriacigeorgica]|uniref:hypothetical protein n=1 Tax=Nocardia cyriacigeorgica TaxID=135487 RepID=UPI001894A49B|nr:hypothetical protein [Nocardia cyriacigeorgica]MBF6326477.1 hypothetical protein [Nocardia cyriacigeorgica]
MKKMIAGAAVLLFAAVGLVACSAGANSDHGGPKDVRVQKYRDPDTGRSCLIFTHDTMQGASIAVDCQPPKPVQSSLAPEHWGVN